MLVVGTCFSDNVLMVARRFKKVWAYDDLRCHFLKASIKQTRFIFCNVVFDAHCSGAVPRLFRRFKRVSLSTKEVAKIFSK